MHVLLINNHFDDGSQSNVRLEVPEIMSDPVLIRRYKRRREKTGLRDFRPGLTQTDLYSHRSRLEA